MTEELKEIDFDVGHRRVARSMRQNGISVVRTRKHNVTTDSDRKFNIAAIDEYVQLRERWLYLAVTLDLHSKRVIGWAVSNRVKRDLAVRALKMAIFEYIDEFDNPRHRHSALG